VNSDDQDVPKARGKKRMRQLVPAYERDRAALQAALLSDLGREPTTIDRVAAEALSAALISSRRKRAAGRHDLEALKLVTQLLRATGMKPAPGTGPAVPSIQDYLAARNTRDDATE
jgi:hypothetical protein